MNEPVIQTKRPRKQYDKVFKQRAVELWLNSGRAAIPSADFSDEPSFEAEG